MEAINILKKKKQTRKNNNKTIIKIKRKKKKTWKGDQYSQVEFRAYKTAGIMEVYSGFLSQHNRN